MVTKQDLIDYYERWLGHYTWSLVAKLACRGAPSFTSADRLFRVWVEEMRRKDGTREFCWVRVTEYGYDRKTSYHYVLYFHVLIGGMRIGAKKPWIARWEELAGDSSISYHQPPGGIIRYMLKEADKDEYRFTYDADFYGRE
jgi:hypothetical protein